MAGRGGAGGRGDSLRLPVHAGRRVSSELTPRNDTKQKQRCGPARGLPGASPGREDRQAPLTEQEPTLTRFSRAVGPGIGGQGVVLSVWLRGVIFAVLEVQLWRWGTAINFSASHCCGGPPDHCRRDLADACRKPDPPYRGLDGPCVAARWALVHIMGAIPDEEIEGDSPL